MPNFIVISGCSGGGKSTLVAELARRGYPVVEEPGRRIVAEERRGDGAALPWVDLAAFARRAVAMARRDIERVSASEGLVFFDRGLIDAVAALEHATGEPCLARLVPQDIFHRRVFITPPWPEIFVTDEDRRHDFSASLAEYERLLRAYAELGYDVDVLPKIPVEERADHLLTGLERDGLR